MQRLLNAEQINAFYHDEFVQQQVDHFRNIALSSVDSERVVVDIGGGCGHFAMALKNEFGIHTRVIDMDQVSVHSAQRLGIEALIGDALRPEKKMTKHLYVLI